MSLSKIWLGVVPVAVCVSAHQHPIKPTFSVEPFGAHSIRIRVAAPDLSSVQDPPISGLLQYPPDQNHDPPVVSANESIYSMTNGNLRIDIDRSNGFLSATRVSDDKLLLRQTAVSFGSAPVGARQGSVSMNVSFGGLLPGEQVYGFGDHRTGRVNQAPEFYRNFDWSEIHEDANIPFYSSSKGYGFIWNSPALGHVNVTSDGITWGAWATQGLDVWITTTARPEDAQDQPSLYSEIMSHYADVVGHTLPIADWATGFIQSKDRYRNQTQLLDVARGYKTRNLPISMIVIDWFHWVHLGDMTLNPICWPNPQGMVDELEAMGIKLMITFWPLITKPSSHWPDYTQPGKPWLALNTSNDEPTNWSRFGKLIDASNGEALESTYDYWYKGYGKYGVRALWLDATEPQHEKLLHPGEWRLNKGLASEMIMGWVKDWTKGVVNKMKELGTAPHDFFVLSRNAWLGTAANGAALWSGDINSSFHELALQVKVGQGASMSGVFLWTTDIGGFFYGDPASPIFQRLIVRWFQFGAFCPLFRLHGYRECANHSYKTCTANECGHTNGDNEVWNLAQDPNHYEAIVTVMKLRESLRDYVKKIHHNESVAKGWPMMRPMVFHYGNDPGVIEAARNDWTGPDIEAQFMLGPKWLIAPVTTDNATFWPVYLPTVTPTKQWVYYWNNSAIAQDGQWLTVKLSLQNMTEFPLFYLCDKNTSFETSKT